MILFLIPCSIYSQVWKLQKETKTIKAYTSKIDGSSIKSYKVVATLNTSIECVYSLLSDYNNYPKMYKNLDEMKILKDGENEIKAYTVYDLPWPVQNIDMVSQVIITKNDNIIKFKTNSLINSEIEKKKNLVRIIDFKEEFVIKRAKNNQSEITIIGRIDVGGSIPVWVQNLFVIDGPINIINFVDEKCKRR